ncbi:MAG: rod shape-determining protein MreD [Acidimicrobiia bacterium]|nr:rod shape-determining protein MreD [Acidimicrobiia bacterium]
MRARAIFWSLFFLVLAVVLQTTLFSRLAQFRIFPDVVLLVVILSARWLDPDPALLLGFTGGVAVDLLGTTPLGLRALVMTLVAYASVKTVDRFDLNPISLLISAVVLSLLGVVLLAVLGTLFGQGSLAEGNVVRTILLVPVFNGILALVVATPMRRLMTASNAGAML